MNTENITFFYSEEKKQEFIQWATRYSYIRYFFSILLLIISTLFILPLVITIPNALASDHYNDMVQMLTTAKTNEDFEKAFTHFNLYNKLYILIFLLAFFLFIFITLFMFVIILIL